MDSKSLAIGFICGAVFGALVVWSIADRSQDEAVPVVEQQSETNIEPEKVAIEPPIQEKPQELPDVSEPDTGDLQTPIEPANQPVLRWPDNNRAEFESEPKDDSWAYYMEQTLLQFLSTHRLIDQFDISSIECRSTRCQIEVFGFDESTKPVWSQVMYDINQQPWSEFGQYGSGSGDVDGRFLIVATLHREAIPE